MFNEGPMSWVAILLQPKKDLMIVTYHSFDISNVFETTETIPTLKLVHHHTPTHPPPVFVRKHLLTITQQH